MARKHQTDYFQAFVDLVEYCCSASRELVKTLKMYLEHGNELVSTAADMYIHRNTLVNRMKKIDALLGVNVNDPETRYEFGTVYRILEYYGAL